MAGTLDDEAIEAAADMLCLFDRARGLVGQARVMRARGEAGWWPLLADMLTRLSEVIVDDCLLFGETGTIALFEFFGAWRRAAYEHDHGQEAAADRVLEECHQRVAAILRG